MRRKTLCGFVVAALLGIALADVGRAAPITWEFEGTVRTFGPAGYDATLVAAGLGVAVDAPVSGSFTYESTTPDSDPPNGWFSGALTDFSVTIGSYTPVLDLTSPYNAFYVRTHLPYGEVDLEIVTASIAPDLLFPEGAIVALSLLAEHTGVIPVGILPAIPPSLDALRPFAAEDWVQLSFGTGIAVVRGGTRALIELSRVERVPEPTPLAFIALALGVLAIRRSACSGA